KLAHEIRRRKAGHAFFAVQKQYQGPLAVRIRTGPGRCTDFLDHVRFGSQPTSRNAPDVRYEPGAEIRWLRLFQYLPPYGPHFLDEDHNEVNHRMRRGSPTPFL